MRRIGALVVAISFLLNSTVFAVDNPAELIAAASHLAPPLRFGALGDQHHKNIALAKMNVEAELLATDAFRDIDGIDNLAALKAAWATKERLQRGQEYTEQTHQRRSRATITAYFNQVEQVGRYIFRVPVSVVIGGETFSYFLLFSTIRSEDVFPVVWCTDEEFTQLAETVTADEARGIYYRIIPRDSRDEEAFRRYIELNEKTIDPWIKRHFDNPADNLSFSGTDHARQLFRRIVFHNSPLGQLNANAGFARRGINNTLSQQLDKNSLYLLKVGSNEELPVIEEGGKKVTVGSHASRARMHIFVSEQVFEIASRYLQGQRLQGAEWDELCAAISPKVFHELGVQLDFDWTVEGPQENARIVNDLDRAVDEISATTARGDIQVPWTRPVFTGLLAKIADHLASPRVRQGINLDHNLQRRDYASGVAPEEISVAYMTQVRGWTEECFSSRRSTGNNPEQQLRNARHPAFVAAFLSILCKRIRDQLTREEQEEFGKAYGKQAVQSVDKAVHAITASGRIYPDHPRLIALAGIATELQGQAHRSTAPSLIPVRLLTEPPANAPGLPRAGDGDDSDAQASLTMAGTESDAASSGVPLKMSVAGREVSAADQPDAPAHPEDGATEAEASGDSDLAYSNLPPLEDIEVPEQPLADSLPAQAGSSAHTDHAAEVMTDLQKAFDLATQHVKDTARGDLTRFLAEKPRDPIVQIVVRGLLGGHLTFEWTKTQEPALRQLVASATAEPVRKFAQGVLNNGGIWINTPADREGLLATIRPMLSSPAEEAAPALGPEARADAVMKTVRGATFIAQSLFGDTNLEKAMEGLAILSKHRQHDIVLVIVAAAVLALEKKNPQLQQRALAALQTDEAHLRKALDGIAQKSRNSFARQLAHFYITKGPGFFTENSYQRNGQHIRTALIAEFNAAARDQSRTADGRYTQAPHGSPVDALIIFGQKAKVFLRAKGFSNADHERWAATVSERTRQRDRERLIKAGYLEQITPGQYRITAAGAQAILYLMYHRQHTSRLGKVVRISSKPYDPTLNMSIAGLEFARIVLPFIFPVRMFSRVDYTEYGRNQYKKYHDASVAVQKMYAGLSDDTDILFKDFLLMVPLASALYDFDEVAQRADAERVVRIARSRADYVLAFFNDMDIISSVGVTGAIDGYLERFSSILRSGPRMRSDKLLGEIISRTGINPRNKKAIQQLRDNVSEIEHSPRWIAAVRRSVRDLQSEYSHASRATQKTLDREIALLQTYCEMLTSKQKADSGAQRASFQSAAAGGRTDRPEMEGRTYADEAPQGRSRAMAKDDGRTKPGRSPESSVTVIALSKTISDAIAARGYFTFKEYRDGYNEVRERFPQLNFAVLPAIENDTQSRDDLEQCGCLMITLMGNVNWYRLTTDGKVRIGTERRMHREMVANRQRYEARREALKGIAESRGLVPFLGAGAVELYNQAHGLTGVDAYTSDQALSDADLQKKILTWAVATYNLSGIPVMMDLTNEHESIINALASPEKRDGVDEQGTPIMQRIRKGAHLQLKCTLARAGIDWQELITKSFDDIVQAGRMDVFAKTASLLRTEFGDHKAKIAYVKAPFSLVGDLMGEDEAITARLMESEEFFALMQWAEEFCGRYAEYLLEHGADMVAFLDPTASINPYPDYFPSISTDVINRLSLRVRSKGGLVAYHPCRALHETQAGMLLPEEVVADVDLLSVDAIVPLRSAYETMVSTRAARGITTPLPYLIGNIDTLHTLALGTAADVEREVEELFASMEGIAFILGTSCDCDPTQDTMTALAQTAARQREKFTTRPGASVQLGGTGRYENPMAESTAVDNDMARMTTFDAVFGSTPDAEGLRKIYDDFVTAVTLTASVVEDSRTPEGVIRVAEIGVIPVRREDATLASTILVDESNEEHSRRVGIYQSFIEDIYDRLVGNLAEASDARFGHNAPAQRAIIAALLEGAAFHELGHALSKGAPAMNAQALFNLCMQDTAARDEMARSLGIERDEQWDDTKFAYIIAESFADSCIGGLGQADYVAYQGAYLFFVLLSARPHAFLSSSGVDGFKIRAAVDQYFADNPHLAKWAEGSRDALAQKIIDNFAAFYGPGTPWYVKEAVARKEAAAPARPPRKATPASSDAATVETPDTYSREIGNAIKACTSSIMGRREEARTTLVTIARKGPAFKEAVVTALRTALADENGEPYRLLNTALREVSRVNAARPGVSVQQGGPNRITPLQSVPLSTVAMHELENRLARQQYAWVSTQLMIIYERVYHLARERGSVLGNDVAAEELGHAETICAYIRAQGRDYVKSPSFTDLPQGVRNFVTGDFSDAVATAIIAQDIKATLTGAGGTNLQEVVAAANDILVQAGRRTMRSLPETADQDKTALIFSEKVIFEHGLAVLLPSLAEAGINVAVVTSNNKEEEIIRSLLVKQGKIVCGRSIADIQSTIHFARYRYFKVDDDKDVGEDPNSTFDITMIVDIIAQAFGRACKLSQTAIDDLPNVMRRFAEFARAA